MADQTPTQNPTSAPQSGHDKPAPTGGDRQPNEMPDRGHSDGETIAAKPDTDGAADAMTSASGGPSAGATQTQTQTQDKSASDEPGSR